jgi:hypothetical protein
MTHPAKPAPLEPLEPRDEPVWLALLAAADDSLRVNMRCGEAAAVLLMQGTPMHPADAEAALDRIEATGRIERDPGGLRVCVERVTPLRFQRITSGESPLTDGESTHGSTQKGTRETGRSE